MDVAADLMELIRGKRYKRVSAEVYNDPPDGCVGRGKTARRVAVLGGEQPQVKGLRHIPIPDAHSERFADTRPARVHFHSIERLPDGAFAVFSEVAGDQPMNKEALMAILQQKLGVDPARLGDELLGEIAAACGAGQQAPPEPHPMDMGEGDEMPDPADDEQKAAFAENARKFACNARRYFDRYGGGAKFSDFIASKFADGEGDDNADDDKDMPMKMSEVRRLVADSVKAALREQAEDIKKANEEARKFSEEFASSQKKNAIESFCESRLKEGKLLPYEVDDASPASVKRRLYRADSKAAVHKFSEGGKTVQLTELEMQMREIDDRKPRFFGERFKQPAGRQGGEDAELEKVERFCEDPKIVHALASADKTPADFVEGFKAAKKANPKLTAEQYGVSA